MKDRDEYTQDELDFLRAMDSYKREKQRPYPTWHETLQVLKDLGYKKVQPDSLALSTMLAIAMSALKTCGRFARSQTQGHSREMRLDGVGVTVDDAIANIERMVKEIQEKESL
jgi:hypothetical protein